MVLETLKTTDSEFEPYAVRAGCPSCWCRAEPYVARADYSIFGRESVCLLIDNEPSY